jgi:hypothetical protein
MPPDDAMKIFKLKEAVKALGLEEPKPLPPEHWTEEMVATLTVENGKLVAQAVDLSEAFKALKAASGTETNSSTVTYTGAALKKAPVPQIVDLSRRRRAPVADEPAVIRFEMQRKREEE